MISCITIQFALRIMQHMNRFWRALVSAPAVIFAAAVLPAVAQPPANQAAAANRPPAQQRLSESTGVTLFASHCTQCHGIVPVEHAPAEATIRSMPPESIYAAITTGTMAANAASLTDAEKRLLAEFMGGRKLDKDDVGDARNMPNRCSSAPP